MQWKSVWIIIRQRTGEILPVQAGVPDTPAKLTGPGGLRVRPSQYKGGLIPNEEDHLQARVRHRNRYPGEKAPWGNSAIPPVTRRRCTKLPAACTSCISVAALHLPMPRRTSSAWPRARWTPGSNPTECAVCCTKASGSGNGSAFGGVSTLWAFALGKGDASYA